MAREEIDRIGTILRHLLDIHRPHSSKSTPVDLNAIIERVLLLTAGTLADQRIEVERSLDSNLPTVQGRPDQLTQVVLNVTLNAAEAMPHGGTLHFKTFQQHQHIVLRVIDNGVGMTSEVQSHVFEPFFITKPKGTGLGLTISQRILGQYNGTIELTSTPYVGTTITIMF